MQNNDFTRVWTSDTTTWGMLRERPHGSLNKATWFPHCSYFFGHRSDIVPPHFSVPCLFISCLWPILALCVWHLWCSLSPDTMTENPHSFFMKVAARGTSCVPAKPPANPCVQGRSLRSVCTFLFVSFQNTLHVVPALFLKVLMLFLRHSERRYVAFCTGPAPPLL